MARTWFSQGLKGAIARDIQADLLKQGFFAGDHDTFIDGDFGGHTVSALQQLQAARALPTTGAVDDATWRQITVAAIPTLFERCLGLTASFEGNGFTQVEGNFDGAGLTWGIIGFTLSNGEIQGLLREIEQAAPGTLARVMGADLAAQWSARTAQPIAQQLAWADSISSGPGKLGLPRAWVDAFQRLGQEPLVQRLQMHHAYDSYFVPAAATAGALGLSTELGLALCFDCHVQNGRARLLAVQDLQRTGRAPTEAQQRAAFARAVASHASPAYQGDVLARKMAIATGAGTVHGRAYTLAHWGLDEFPAA
ncbi:MAG: chitosanase [Burkholderiales bacterium]|nr:chitosanase [Burkholderiales bacterium]